MATDDDSDVTSVFRGVKMNKLERKLMKKHTKKICSLIRDCKGLTVADSPTQNLFIGNGGLINGISRDHILSAFSKYGSIKSIHMIPGKSFALLSYNGLEPAMRAISKMNTTILPLKSRTDTKSVEITDSTDEKKPPGVTLYLCYVSLSDVNDMSVSLAEYPSSAACANVVPGLTLCKEFLNEQYEKALTDYFQRKADNSNTNVGSVLKHRQVMHFGYEFLYGSNNIDRSNPLHEKVPEICKILIDKMKNEAIINWEPDQLTVNIYAPGQGIPPHVDTHSAFEEPIISVSMGSQVTMEFRHPDGRHKPVILPRRSLLAMKGESRYLWTHGITPRKSDIVYSEIEGKQGLTLVERGTRISLTFRRIRHQPCKCDYPIKCDCQEFSKPEEPKNELFVPISQEEASNLESGHVHYVYEEIAEHFSDTRHTPWPRVKQFLMTLNNGSLVADVGCGNGKYLGVNSNIVKFGSDRSFNLAAICRDRGFPVLVADCLSLPYRSDSFDAAICIAVIHHLSTQERRLEAIIEMTRIVRKGGRILIYVWAIEQEDEQKSSSTKKEEKSVSGKNSPRGDLEDVVNGLQTSLNLKDNLNQPIIKGNEPTKIDFFSPDQEIRTRIQVNEARNVFQQQDLLIPWHKKVDTVKKTPNKADALNGVVSKPAENKETVFHRYYHVFKAGELSKLCSSVSGIRIVEEYLDRGNWCVILEKK